MKREQNPVRLDIPNHNPDAPRPVITIMAIDPGSNLIRFKEGTFVIPRRSLRPNPFEPRIH